MKIKLSYITVPQGIKKEIFINASEIETFVKIFNASLHLYNMIVLGLEVVEK